MAIYYNELNVRYSGEKAQANAVFIRDYLLAKGWTLTAICGAMGNFDAETGGSLNPNTYENWTVKPDIGNYGYGLAQWTPWLGKAGYEDAESQRHYHGSNNPTFGRWCLDNGRDKATMEAQLDYLDAGLGGYKSTSTFPESFEDFKTSSASANYLAKEFYVNYERSAAGNYGDRPDRADEWYDFLSGGDAPPVDPDPEEPDPDEPDPDEPDEPEEPPYNKPGKMSLPVFLAATRRRLHVVR